VSASVQSLSIKDIKELPPYEWLVEGVIPRHGLSCLYGPPGVGKSFLALDLALRIGCGLPWLNRPAKEGHVGYVFGEGEHGLKQRLAAWGIQRVLRLVTWSSSASRSSSSINRLT
jgi:hypothetical protein